MVTDLNFRMIYSVTNFLGECMFYKLKRFTFVRNINDYLQIIDKRNDTEIIGDYISYLFAKELSYEFKNIDILVHKICEKFDDSTDFNIVKNDAINFYEKLFEFGLVSKKENLDALEIEQTVNNEKKYANILLPKEEYKIYQKVRKEKPCLQHIMIEITKICNERCIHCYIPHENKNIMMDDNIFYDIVNQAVELGTVVSFKISGGECMLHPLFKSFIKYIKEKGFALTVLTNLTLLDDETINILREGSYSDVQVSLFSLNPKIHDKITTVKGSFDKTIKNLDKLYHAGIDVSIATQVMEINKDSIEDLYKYTKKYNFKFRCDWTIIPQEDKNCSNLSCRVENLLAYEDICKLRIKYDEGYKEELKEELSYPPKSEDKHLCNAGTNGIAIDANLNVHPCAGWGINVGSLKVQKLLEIWEKSELLSKIRNVVLRDFPKCKNCNIRNLCSICMAHADLEKNAENFKFEMPEYSCKMYNVIYNTIRKELSLS